MLWTDAVLHALHRFSAKHLTRNIDRQALIDEELDQIVTDTGSSGATPSQTLSRVLQELRDNKLIEFIGQGNYLLLDTPMDVESETLPDEALDIAIRQGKLRLGILPASNQMALARRRKGQHRIRVATLDDYGHRCAFCEINKRSLLVASHIARWRDDPEGRGNLTNVICACRFHDTLFEFGYFSLSNEYQILKTTKVVGSTLALLLDHTTKFRPPSIFQPAPEFLYKHRLRTGLGA